MEVDCGDIEDVEVEGLNFEDASSRGAPVIEFSVSLHYLSARFPSRCR